VAGLYRPTGASTSGIGCRRMWQLTFYSNNDVAGRKAAVNGRYEECPRVVSF